MPDERPSSDRHRFPTGIVLGILGTLVFFLAVIPLALLHRRDLPLERAYSAAAIGLASRVGGGDRPNPLPQNRRVLEDGRIAFIGSCSACHGANGDGRGVF